MNGSVLIRINDGLSADKLLGAVEMGPTFQLDLIFHEARRHS